MDDRFCNLCDVSLDLHDGPNSCGLAESKVRLFQAFYPVGHR